MIAKAVLVALLTIGCSDPGMPPPIQDSDGGIIGDNDGSTQIVPCSTPSASCPCSDAGAKYYCGVIYRVSGKHVDCSPGYLTCQDDGTWSECLGAQIYDGK
jgi:hypothetical protein